MVFGFSLCIVALILFMHLLVSAYSPITIMRNLSASEIRFSMLIPDVSDSSLRFIISSPSNRSSGTL